MKTTVAPYETRTYCVRIEPVHSGASVVRLTDYPYNLEMSNGEVYNAENGYQFSGIETSNDMSPGSLDLSGILQSPGVTRDQLAAGLYDNARVYAFATDWSNPVEDEEPLAKLLFGKVEIVDDTYKVQLMTLIDAVSQTYSESYSASCPFTLGDSRCKVDLDALEEATDIAAVTDLRTMQVNSAEADDYYAYGTIEFTTGNNANLGRREIKSADASGNLVLFHPFQYEIEVGDQVVLRPGCRKRPKSDCKEKFNNKINFGGFEYIPTKNQATQWGKK